MHDLTYLQFLGPFVLLLVLGLIAYGILALVANWYFYKKFYDVPGWVAIVPFYNVYVQSQKTFGNEFGWIGLVATLVPSITYNFLSSSGEPFLPVMAVSIIAMLFDYFAYSRVTRNTGLNILSVLFGPIGLFFILKSKESKYIGPTKPFWVK